MSAPVIQGWCPGALRPMMSGDGLVVRVRPRGGRLTPGQAKGIAELSARYGNGLIDLSARANVQLRGVSEAGHGALIAGLAALGLIDETAEAEARRNITVTPFWQEGDGVQDVAATLASALAAPDAPQTPGKFGYAIDCGPVPVLQGVSADIRIERARGGLCVRPDSAATGAFATAATVAPRALELARWFLASGGAPAGRGRMAAHLAAGARVPDLFREVPAAPHGPAPAPVPGPAPTGYLVGVEFGQLAAHTLAALSGCGALRVTPWRMLLIEGAEAPPDLPGLIAGPHNPLLRVSACTGAPGCPQAHVATRALARALGQSLPAGLGLHVSGCAKGCAHPGKATLTLVGRPGSTVDLIRDGATTDAPSACGLDPAGLTLSSLIEIDDAP
ncbi:precorrin-3B synthase [Albidovulum sediminis]|uniref:Precorrin-3B synthase n=1 Tax=Albidovulum sediminis TaxID=3066345 RepID=A0ABT2NN80_9RHOB|nr:precorrin-3B synthase [Defluviimonas sediminis]MCT8330181.1 precorrin-3B synthase [Defluviimonas sediminis]